MPDLSSMFCVPLGGVWKNKRVASEHGCDLVSIYQSHFGIYQTPRTPQVLGSHSFPFLPSLLTCNQLYFNCIKIRHKKIHLLLQLNGSFVTGGSASSSIKFCKQRTVTILELVAFYKHPHICMTKPLTLLFRHAHIHAASMEQRNQGT